MMGGYVLQALLQHIHLNMLLDLLISFLLHQLLLFCQPSSFVLPT